MAPLGHARRCRVQFSRHSPDGIEGAYSGSDTELVLSQSVVLREKCRQSLKNQPLQELSRRVYHTQGAEAGRLRHQLASILVQKNKASNLPNFWKMPSRRHPLKTTSGASGRLAQSTTSASFGVPFGLGEFLEGRRRG